MIEDEETNQLTPADEEIRRCMNERKSFLIDAGAGSGKTSSLVNSLLYLIETKKDVELARSSQGVACITFTKVAKNEIIERTGHNPHFHVSTIHDFLWRVTKPHQKALKKALLQHNRDLNNESARKRDPEQLETALKTVEISYSDRGAEFLEGRLFHDDLLDVSFLVFKDNPLMSKIVAARYPFIFVDEYQDTSPAVINILVDHVLEAGKGKIVIGFFGDKFQNIYHGGAHPGVGEIPAGQRAYLTHIFKEENYRCSKAVIALLNRIRTDIKQFPAGKNKDVEGSAVYIRLNTGDAADEALSHARNFVQKTLGWDLAEDTQKELFLTHKLIAKKAGYERLLDVYATRGGFYRDQLVSGEDKFISFFQSRIESLIAAWREGSTGKVLSILRDNGFKLEDNKGKARAKKALDDLAGMQPNATIGEVLAHIDKSKLLVLLDDLKEAMKIHQKPAAESGKPDDEKEAAKYSFYRSLLETPYIEVPAFCGFLEEHTPFSTKHGVKGTQFDTVFVVLDDKGARWNQYSFDKYLSDEDAVKLPERAQRTRNLFYVCCSRAKKNVAVLDLGPSSKNKDERIKQLFGPENCYF